MRLWRCRDGHSRTTVVLDAFAVEDARSRRRCDDYLVAFLGSTHPLFVLRCDSCTAIRCLSPTAPLRNQGGENQIVAKLQPNFEKCRQLSALDENEYTGPSRARVATSARQGLSERD